MARKMSMDAPASPEFKLLAEEKLEFAQDVRLLKWESQSTGLKVIWADVESPLVQGYFATTTEIFDDSGRPHTLEHLIFMGSEQYPYKGILDTIANRSFANGTNAWTDTTNTTYTVGTAGEEGFLSILPVYLDHVLYPTMTKSGFVTEVHHINAKGEDSGVVYSEMQGRENGSGDLMQLRLQRTLYGEKNALRSETGGLMEALRKLTVEQIREYHGSMYVPQNISLIVVGRSLEPSKLLATLEAQVIPSIKAHGQVHGPRGPSGWKRPFVESSTAKNPPKISEDRVEKVFFPEKDESVGEIMLSWLGVESNDFMTETALECLGEYLTDSPISPLYKEFVEVEEPACTDITFYSSTENPSILTVYLSSVPSALLDTLDTRLKAFLAKLANTEFDMSRMKSVIHNQKLQLLESVETNPADLLSNAILADAIYGKPDASELGPSLKAMTHLNKLESWTSQQWADLLTKFYVKASSVTVRGIPSAALADKLEKEDKARIAATVAKLGPQGLAAAGQQVEKAQAENDRPIPEHLISKFKVPDVDGIEWIKVESARSKGVAADRNLPGNRVQQHVDQDSAELPLFVQFDHINSEFIDVSIILFVSDLPGTDPAALRALLPIYLDSFFSLPVTRADGTQLSFEQVVKALDAETLSYRINIENPLQEGIRLSIKVAKDSYPVAVSWLSDLLYNSTFSVDRLAISASKAIQNLPSEKRDGSDVSFAAYRQLINSNKSANLAMNLLNRDEFLPDFAARLKSEPEKVVQAFETLRKSLTNPKTIRVQVKGNILSLDKPSATWKTHFKPIEKFDRSELVPVTLGKDVLQPLPKKKLVVFGVSSIESSFAYHVAKGPDSFEHEDVPALTVARAVLNAMEGFLWKHIRGAGLAYGANISQDIETGTIYYRVYKSPDSYAAFAAARDLINALVAGEISIDELTIESAKSSLAYNTAAKESTINAAANAAFSDMLYSRPQSYGRVLLARTKPVTAQDILRVIKKYVAPIFNPEESIGAIASGLAKMEEIAERFEKLGYQVERRTFDVDDDESGSEDGSASESGSE